MIDHKEFAKKMRAYTVLYVEDDVEVRQYMTEFLRRYCKAVYATDNAATGLTLYKEHRPDILLLDINLPGMSGIDLAASIRESDPLTRIIMSTAYTDKEFMLKAVELGLTRYLVKPVTSEDIFAAFEKCMIELVKLAPKYSEVDLGEAFIYNKKLKSLLKDGMVMALRKKETDLLEFFIDRPNEVVTYALLETAIWNDQVMTSDAIRSQIKNLRKKIHPQILKNVSGVGYRLYQKSDI